MVCFWDPSRLELKLLPVASIRMWIVRILSSVRFLRKWNVRILSFYLPSLMYGSCWSLPDYLIWVLSINDYMVVDSSLPLCDMLIALAYSLW